MRLNANSLSINLLVTGLVLVMVFLLPWMDRRLCGKLGLNLEGGIAGDDVFLTVDYAGDQAELLLEGRKIADDYYRGEPWEIGLKRWDFPKTLLLRIFALREEAPVFTDEPLPFEHGRALRLNGVTAKEEFRVRLSPETLFSKDGESR